MCKKIFTALTLAIAILSSCRDRRTSTPTYALNDTTDRTEVHQDTAMLEALPPTTTVDTRDVHPEELLTYAKGLIGTPYLYGSTDPQKGFDCSGFITHVFNQFKIGVPRSSKDFTNTGTEVSLAESKPGDLILFTGTDSTQTEVGHMGIVLENQDTLKFIHSTSGKAYGVTVSPLNASYQRRFVKTVRVFE